MIGANRPLTWDARKTAIAIFVTIVATSLCVAIYCALAAQGWRSFVQVHPRWKAVSLMKAIWHLSFSLAQTKNFFNVFKKTIKILSLEGCSTKAISNLLAEEKNREKIEGIAKNPGDHITDVEQPILKKTELLEKARSSGLSTAIQGVILELDSRSSRNSMVSQKCKQLMFLYENDDNQIDL